MFKSKMVLRAALVVMVCLSFAIGGGRVFADDGTVTDTTGNTVAADNSADQSANAGPATVAPDPTTTNDQSDTTPDSGTPPVSDSTPPADPSTDNSGTTDGSQTPPTTPVPPVCVAPSTDTTPADPTTDPSGSGQTDSTSNLGINNNICGAANSGNASVTGNGSGGNATSGDADSEATILNIIQSITGLSGSQLATFVQNIGSGTGDITLDPALLAFLAGGGCTLCGANGGLNSTVNSTINNNINLSANSGNADVSDNGSGGNATSGDATALLNLINIINSIIASNKSFIGIININGNLNGDILLPPDLLESLMGSSSSPQTDSPGTGQLDSSVTQGVNNNVNLSANSGNANVSDNGTGGNATTGNSLTKLTLLNLTGSQIIGQNALLVFINVLGSWVGMIVNAPAGATTATLGDATASGATPDGDVNSTTNSQINNNINLSAATGNASVTGNASGGNATSGNATASANIINIINSDISLSGWFGILFINVFGNWTGSFGIDTSAGDPPVVPGSSSDNSGGSGQAAVVTTAVVHHFFTGAAGSTTPTDTNTNDNNQVLGASTDNGSGPLTDAATSGPNLMVGLAGGILCFFLLGAVERRREQRKGQLIPVAPAPLINQWQ